MLDVKALLTKVLMNISSLNADNTTLMTATTKGSFWTIQTATQTQTIAASNGATFTPTNPTVSGYTPVCVIGRGSNHGNTITMAASGTFSTYAYNRLTSAQSTTVTHWVLYLKNVAQGR